MFAGYGGTRADAVAETRGGGIITRADQSESFGFARVTFAQEAFVWLNDHALRCDVEIDTSKRFRRFIAIDLGAIEGCRTECVEHQETGAVLEHGDLNQVLLGVERTAEVSGVESSIGVMPMDKYF